MIYFIVLWMRTSDKDSDLLDADPLKNAIRLKMLIAVNFTKKLQKLKRKE